ncbi:hypothetical protein A8709_33115 [Paenibacillus pectinilyticus]|uniref:Uncharacterized protein n=1 Tax=Paenibacillus pectinilyticus TaxID=512399 RepID=A0A1C0ZX08_9BACL|nr:hypothetical protein [Paenibacillus pectinilyticus]OCT12653.1 hypothetical protein A8709_33115 [Paenibacillus pectinilyticus]
MGEYFECELRLNGEYETKITTVNFRLLPRIGEHISTKLDGITHQFKITDIWHWVGDKMTGHEIIIYVNHTGK